MSAHTVTFELYYSAAWHDHTSSFLIRTPVKFSRAYSPVTLEAIPSALDASIRSVDGAWSPLNPNSAIYGLVGRNTPIRITVDGAVRWIGEASWKPKRNAGGDRWTVITAAGVLQRLNRGSTPLRAALERGVLFGAPIGYWQLNDAKGSTSAASSIEGGVPLPLIDSPLFSEDTAPEGPAGAPGKYVCVRTLATGRLGGLGMSLTTSTTGRIDIEFICYVDPDTTSDDLVRFVGWDSTGTQSHWTIDYQYDTSSNIEILAVYGREVKSSTTASGVSDVVTNFRGNWNHVRATITQSGGNQLVELWLNGVSHGIATTVNTVGRILNITTDPQEVFPDIGSATVYLGHLAVYDSASEDNGSAYTGWTGETASARMTRICAEEGVTITVLGTAAETTPMGPQPTATLTAILSETARTDGGVLFEDSDAIGLVYKPLSELYNQTTAQTLSWSGDITPTGAPVLDDRDVRNDVQATQGSLTARVTLTTGPMSIQAPPTGVGRYDTRLDVNPAAATQLADIAGWFLATRTSEKARWDNLIVDLDASAVDVTPIDVGSVIELSNVPVTEDPNTPRLLVTSLVEESTNHRRTLAIGTTQADMYDVGVLDTSGYLDCGACTTSEALTTTETLCDVLCADACAWTHVDGDYDVIIAGERCTVKAVSAVGGTSGAYTQTLTLTRSVNGVVKAHATGQSVHVADPFILAR